jgi:uncharacterized protein involved in oxidation of intracellular sulfur
LVFSQAKPNYFACENVIAFEESLTPDLGIIIYSDDVETVWNAMRLAVYSQTKGDTVVVFVLAKGVDAFMLEQDASAQYNVQEISDTFLRGGGFIYLCATCAKTRNTEEIQSCTITSIADLYSIVNKSKKVLTF